MASCAKKAKGEITNPNWLELPRDLTKNILQRLGPVEIVTSARNVCPLWWMICKDPQMWRAIHIDCIIFIPFGHYSLEKICRCTIDLSCGQLEDIAIQLFGTDELLKYISHRVTHLRRLSLSMCDEISNKGLCEFVKCTPLEEVEILFSKDISKETLEVIGQSCPLLKSLNIMRLLPYPGIEDYDDAFVIAKSMTGLCHLKLSGVYINCDGLHAILDCCPLLQSLDLQGCRGLYMTPCLGKKCREQIKEFVPPDYTVMCLIEDGYE